jgi:hypothetical protein
VWPAGDAQSSDVLIAPVCMSTVWVQFEIVPEESE